MLRTLHRHKPRKMSKADLAEGAGPMGRISKLRKLVTGIVRHERIEALTDHADEARGYVERVCFLITNRNDLIHFIRIFLIIRNFLCRD